MVEPSADIRQTAAQIRQFYIAFLNEGFSDMHAMTLVLQIMAGARTS